MPETLRDKTVRGVGWSFADSILSIGVSFLVGLVLARLLTPDEYGLIGIALIFINVLNSIVDSGLSNALIRKKDATDVDFSTVFIANLVLSLVTFGTLYVIAPSVSRFFGRPELIPLIRVMGSLVLINAFALIQNTVLTKRLDFKTKTKASLISAMVSAVVGIGMAFSGFGVWALVGQALSRQLINTVCLWLLNHWWPRLVFSWQSFKSFWNFGWKLLVSGLIDTTWNELYQVVIGKFYSPASLGQYTRAKQFSQLVSQNITSVVQRVSYPALAEIQDDKDRMTAAYRKVIKTTMFFTVISLFFLGAISEPLIYCLIGPQWQKASTFLPIICLSATLYPLSAINLNMLQVQGRSDLFLKLEIVKKLIAVGPLLAGIFVGIYWMLIGSIIIGIIAFFLNSYYSGKFLGYSSLMQLKDIAPAYGIALPVALSVYFLKYLPISNYVILPIQIAVGGFLVLTICEKIRLEEYSEIKGMAKQWTKKLL